MAQELSQSRWPLAVSWRYAEPPQLTSEYPGRFDGDLNLVGCTNAAMTSTRARMGGCRFKTGTNPDSYETLAKVTNWSINQFVRRAEYNIARRHRQHIHTNGLRNTTGTCRIFYYDDTSGSPATNSAKTLIDKLIKARTTGGLVA